MGKSKNYLFFGTHCSLGSQSCLKHLHSVYSIFEKTAGYVINRCLQTHVPFRGLVIFFIFSAFRICFVAKRCLQFFCEIIYIFACHRFGFLYS